MAVAHLKVLQRILMSLVSLMAMQRDVALQVPINPQVNMLVVSHMNLDKVVHASHHLKEEIIKTGSMVWAKKTCLQFC